MNFYPIPEEQDNEELISSLQQIYQMPPEDQASLARIQAHLFHETARQFHEYAPASHEPQSAELVPYHFILNTLGHPGPKKPWLHHLNLVAAVLVVLLLLGVTVSTLLLVKGKRPSEPAGQTTITPAPIPSEPRSLLGKGTSLDAQGIFMATLRVGWAIPGERSTQQGPVLRSIDGGKSWQHVVLPQELSSQHFQVSVFDENMAFLLPLTGQGDNLQPYFYRTIDAGVTWQRGNLPTTPPPLPQYSSGTRVFDWTFLDHLHGWMSVWTVPCCGGVISPVPLSELGGETLFHTQDGGLSWQHVARLSLKYPGTNLFFTTPQTGWLITAIDDPAHPQISDPSSFPAALLVTHDGGQTWQQHPLPPLPQASAKAAYESPIFFTAKKGYLFNYVSGSGNVDGGEYLYITQDGGNSWQIRGTATPSGGLYVVDDTHISDSIFLYTLTNGQWVRTSNMLPGGSSARIEYLSSQIGVTLVGNSRVYSTSDGGKSWQMIGILPAGA